MTQARFKFALQQLDGTQWRRFEQLASSFLATEFGSLRTTASPSGDRGRDAELFAPDGDSGILFQYSVASDWKSKIATTGCRIAEEFPEATVLIYMTNQDIGADGDESKTAVRKNHGLTLDIRDLHWFLDRVSTSERREVLAEDFAAEIADPILRSKEVLAERPGALSNVEARAAHVFLALQWEDDSRDKGLTRVCFEALVRGVLRDTSSDSRIGRAQVHAEIQSLLPNHPGAELDRRTDAALARLTKRSIRHWTKDDEFCLTYEEHERQLDRLAEFGQQEQLVLEAIESAVAETAPHGSLNSAGLAAVRERVRRVLDRVLWARGEDFAHAVATGALHTIGLGDLRDRALEDLAEHPGTADVDGLVEVVEEVTRTLILDPPDAIQHHLSITADAYTLLGFLRETPDVQGAIRKMFSGGEIWLDTSICLPVLAEELMDEGRRKYESILSATSAAGIALHVTRGVVEELERHINRCLACARMEPSRWRGPTPFLLQMFLLAGRRLQEFPTWVERFAGRERPEDDLAEYLQEVLGVEVLDLPEAEDAPANLRYAVQELWHEIHERRRSRSLETADMISTNRLVLHDVESYCGVVQRRRQEGVTPFGHGAWWLTFDRFAFQVRGRLVQMLDGKVPDSPVMSPDFLVNYLAFGPHRNTVAAKTHQRMPVALEGRVVELAPSELFSRAQAARSEADGLPERVVRRRVRDALDLARKTERSLAKGGVRVMEKEIAEAIDESGL